MSFKSSSFCLCLSRNSKRHIFPPVLSLREREKNPQHVNHHRDSLPRQNSTASASTSQSSSSPLRSSAFDTLGWQLSSSARPPPPVKSIRTRWFRAGRSSRHQLQRRKKTPAKTNLGTCAWSGRNWHYFHTVWEGFLEDDTLLQLCSLRSQGLYSNGPEILKESHMTTNAVWSLVTLYGWQQIPYNFYSTLWSIITVTRALPAVGANEGSHQKQYGPEFTS